MKLSHFAITGLVLLFGAGFYLTMKTELDGQREQFQQQLERAERAQKERDALFAKVLAGSKPEAPVPGETPAPAAPKTNTNNKGKIVPGVDGSPVVATKPPVKAPAAPSEVASAPPSNLVPPDAIPPMPPELQEREENIINDPRSGADAINLDNGKISGAINEEERLSKIQSLIKAQPAIARVKETGAQNGENSDFVVLDRGLQANLAAGDKFSIRRGTIVMGTIVIGDTILENECVANVEKLTEGASVKKGDEIIKWVSR